MLWLEGQNKPGELERIARTLAEHKINIEYAYTANSPRGSRGSMILRVDNPSKAAKVLKTH